MPVGNSKKDTQGTAGASLQVFDDTHTDSIVLETANLVISRASSHVYIHTSFLKTKDFGLVPCNGMIISDGAEAIIFDTPANDASALELINFARKSRWKIKSVVATHFHDILTPKS